MREFDEPWSGGPGESLGALIKPELKPGERLLWASRMDHGSPSNLSRSPASGFAWSLRFGGLALACFLITALTVRMSAEAVATFFVIAGIIAALFCLVVLLGSIVQSVAWSVGRRRLSRRLYALTEGRAIVWDPLPNSSAVTVHSFARGTIRGESLRRMQYPDGSGDVLFGTGRVGPQGFLGVADVRRVEELIREFLIDPPPLAEPEPSYSEL